MHSLSSSSTKAGTAVVEVAMGFRRMRADYLSGSYQVRNNFGNEIINVFVDKDVRVLASTLSS